jgi:radical SAM enzyme (TIGR01210 family)
VKEIKIDLNEKQDIPRRPVGRRPESMAEIYAFAETPRQLLEKFKNNPEVYDKEVRLPFLNIEGKVDTGITTVDGELKHRAFVLLKAPGCQTRKAFRDSGGCANCGFCVFSENYSTGGAPVSPEEYEAQIRFALEQPEVINSEILELFNSGSFFNDNEISPEGRKKVLRAIAEKTPAGKILTVEARFSDIIGNYEKVDEALENFQHDGQHRNLEIAFGLETTDQAIGQAMSKSISQEKLQDLMKELAEREVRPFMYVLIKPDVMSESAAIGMATETVKNIARAAKKIKIPRSVKPHISVSAVRVYSGSMLDSHPGYKASHLWAVTEVIKRLVNEKIDGSYDTAFDYVSMHLGLSDEDIPIAENGSPKNCGNCDSGILASLEHFNGSMDVEKFQSELLDHEKCPCYKEWREQLEDVPVEQISLIPEIQKQQIDLVMKNEEETWPEGTRATRDKFESRARIFPEGFFLAYESGHPVGVTTSEIIQYEPQSPIESWESITNNGYITPEKIDSGKAVGYNEDGNALYVVSVGVNPDYQKRGIGSQLVQEQIKLAKEKGLKYLVLGARVPSLKKAKAKNERIIPEEHIKATRKDGLPVDSELRFYTRNGLKIHEIVPNYMEDDSESLNYGVVMVWENES